MSEKIYQMITDKVLELLEAGVIPWEKSWTGAEPQNVITGREYRGINAFLLGCTGATPYWLTFNQAIKAGGKVKKGAKSMPVIFWKWLEKENKESGEKENRPILRYYRVFNLHDVEGIEAPEIIEHEEGEKPVPLFRCAAIIANMPNAPALYHGSAKPFYRPGEDAVYMPDLENFISAEEYYSVAFHEFGHSTGHQGRLNRAGVVDDINFGSAKYSQEELVAEMTAAFLCGVAEIDNKTIENSIAYIQGWSKKMKDKPTMVVMAAAQAQKASDYILNISFEKGTE